MRYMIDTFKPESHKINFKNSIFKSKEIVDETTTNISESGLLSESSIDSIVSKDIKIKNRFKLQENFVKSGMSKVLTRVLFKPFYDSVYLDKPFKSNYKKQLFIELREAIDSLNPDIYDTYKELSEKSEFLAEICSFCMETVKKAEQKIKDEEEEFPNEFKLDEDILYDVDEYIENNKDLEHLNAIVKDKVVSTISKEKEKNEKEQELLGDIIEENSFLIKNPDKVLEEYSLFKALNINAYKKILKENIEEYITTDDEGNKKVDMDMVISESIVKYTLHEFIHTSNIKEYSSMDIKNLCEELVYNS